MKNFAKFSILALVALLVAAPIAVQAARSTDSSGNPRHPALRRLLLERPAVRQLARRLNLSGEQKDSLQQVRNQAREDLRLIRGDQNLTPAEKRAKARETFRVARQEARSKLLESQRGKLDKLRQRLRERHTT
jgi:hypothetical protein